MLREPLQRLSQHVELVVGEPDLPRFPEPDPLRLRGGLSQLRKHEGEAVDPVIEVLPKQALVASIEEIAVRGGDQTEAGWALGSATERLDRAILKDRQELRLNREGQLADLIQEQSSLIRLREDAFPRPVRPGEHATLVPEQDAFRELGRDRRAVLRDESPLRALA
ncbi:MAG: hypothetical protein U0441_22480 [Polyangiaceae bacterium]